MTAWWRSRLVDWRSQITLRERERDRGRNEIMSDFQDRLLIKRRIAFISFAYGLTPWNKKIAVYSRNSENNVVYNCVFCSLNAKSYWDDNTTASARQTQYGNIVLNVSMDLTTQTMKFDSKFQYKKKKFLFLLPTFYVKRRSVYVSQKYGFLPQTGVLI